VTTRLEGNEVKLTVSRKRAAATAACALTGVVGWAGLASAAGPPSPSQLRKIGSPPSAAKKQPLVGLGSSPFTQPLIVVSFANGRATVLGGSAVSSTSVRSRIANVPISAALCNVNFTNHVASAGGSVSVRWFGGISCTRHLALFGQAFLAESASKFDGSGNFYNGQLQSASSGQANTVIHESNPSLYIWHATNIYFQEKPSRGVIAVLPSPNQQINAATTCKVASNPKYGFGVHCDLYSQRF
jgi:hypothetical protein